MPGIVGLITRMPREWAEQELLRMVATMRHESFYQTGTWMDESLGVHVAWVERKNSFAEGMPLRNERGDVVLVFSGEQFPEPGTPQRLKERGHKLGTEESSYLVHLAEDDPSFPRGCNGRFHGVLAHLDCGTVTLFNDRYGMHRLYYHESKDAFYFAAEAKAILAVRPELRRLDARGLSEFVACGSVLENRTLFEGIYVLPPASAWVFCGGAIKQKGSYFQPKEWEEQERLQPESYYGELREVFARTLPRYFNGHGKIGMSLTGGLDTRIIMAWHRPQPGSLPCYTFGGALRDCQDVVVARQVARLCNQPHQVIRVGEEFLSRFAHYAERTVYLTDGCVDVSRAPDLYLSERVREVAPVRMTGNYGGEVLRRVRAFKPEGLLPGLFSPELLPYVRQVAETYAGLLRGHPLSFAVFQQGPWHHYGVLALEQTQLSMRSPYLDNDFVRTVFRAPELASLNNAVCLRLIADGDAALLAVRTDRGLAGRRGRIFSAASRAFLEFLFKAEYAYDIGMPQWLARLDSLFRPLRLERLFLGRHKIFHFRIWYRNALGGYVRETLLDPRSLSRPYLDRKRLETLVRSHLKGNRNYTAEIHRVLTLELLHRVFLDSKWHCSSSEKRPALAGCAG